MTRRSLRFDPDDLLAPGSTSVDWQQWMRTLGEQVRRMRAFVGLSQEELARRAGVSQGSVSRLESGRGLATPVLVVARINRVLWGALLSWRPRLNPRLRRALEREMARDPGLVTPVGTPDETGVDELVALYERLDEAQRATLIVVVRATAEALSTEPAPAKRS